MRRDYYAVLGIAATAGPREIRQAYRRLARQYSPDVNFWDDGARALFDEIAEAYRILSDPDARAMYDRFGAAPRGEALGPGRRGEDVHIVVALSFAEVSAGATPTLVVTRFSRCVQCDGTGAVPGQGCGPCRGRGIRRVTERVTVTIQPGVDSGTQIRVPGEGHAGPFGGPRGDLIVSTRVREHPFFTRKGDNVHCEVPISVWEALRGARIRVPTPSGETTLVIPPGTAGGQTYRVRGQGLPRLTGAGTGDLYVSVRIETPSGLDARADELVRELERLLPSLPRASLSRYQRGAE
jgi:molecular chaperone DnaJ